jgi:hypothetical protein
MESVILNISEIDKINFSEVLQTRETLKYSVTCEMNKKRTYVTWTGSIPSFVSALTTAEGPYTENKMQSILEDHEWMIII